jgi:alginate O-acetyltransferase complex protein AlgI
VLFNSFTFIVFFMVVTALYFALPHRCRWAMLLLASCVFYMFFIPVYILILFATILVDWLAGIGIEDSADPRRKKAYLLMSILSVCGTLFVFKYFNFFNENAASIARALGWRYPISALRLVLPIGLSFHTFQSLSYVVEVYRGRHRAERHLGIYALYVMYFPQLVAGPIERPQNLLHHFHEEKRFETERVRDGLFLALWGLFKKVVVADSLAIYADAAYNWSGHQTGTTLLVATYFFAFQIYCDFSGYSDIARGISRVYGIELMRNFDTPYFATSISGFWSRWHISLSTWFKDYVYIPLGGNRVSLARNFANLFFVFMLSGLWHGANWTFVAWGSLHGAYLVGERLLRMLRARPSVSSALDLVPAALRRAFAWAVTFHLVLVAWVFFRADHVGTAFRVLRRIATVRGPLFFDPVIVQGLLGIALVVGLDLFHRRVEFWENLRRYPLAFRWGYALALIFAVVLLGIDGGAQFIYFQF